MAVVNHDFGEWQTELNVSMDEHLTRVSQLYAQAEAVAKASEYRFYNPFNSTFNFLADLTSQQGDMKLSIYPQAEYAMIIAEDDSDAISEVGNREFSSLCV